MTNLEIDHAMLRAFVGSRDFKQCKTGPTATTRRCNPPRLPRGVYQHLPWLKDHVNLCTEDER